MKFRLLILVLGYLLISPANLDGQVTNILKNRKKSSEKTTTSSDKKVENKVAGFRDKLLQSIVGEETADTVETDNGSDNMSSTGAGGSLNFSGLLSSGTPLNHKDTYKFTGKIVMEMESTDQEDGVDGTLIYTTYVNTSSNDIAFEMRIISGENPDGSAAIVTICDFDNNVSMLLTDMGGQKTAIASSLDAIEESEFEDAEAEQGENYKLSKTGQTKTILGYKCDGYVATDNENRADLWVSREIPFKTTLKEMNKAGIPLFFADEIADGIVMEMEMFENNVKKGYMKVTEIDGKSAKSIGLGEYSFINMNPGN